MLYWIIVTVFVITCIFLVGIILIQTSKSGGLGAGIAGNAGLNDAFGGQGADKLLVRITTVLAVLFMVLSIALNILALPNDDDSQVSSKSVIQGSNLDSSPQIEEEDSLDESLSE